MAYQAGLHQTIAMSEAAVTKRDKQLLRVSWWVLRCVGQAEGDSMFLLMFLRMDREHGIVSLVVILASGQFAVWLISDAYRRCL